MRVILKLDEANKTVLWFRKLNLNYLWDLIQKLNPIYILDLILANSQLWRSRAGSIYLGLCSLPRTNISLFSNERTNCFIFRKKRGSLEPFARQCNDLQNIIWTKMLLGESFDPISWFCRISQPLTSINRGMQNVDIAKILLQPFLITYLIFVIALPELHSYTF